MATKWPTKCGAQHPTNATLCNLPRHHEGDHEGSDSYRNHPATKWNRAGESAISSYWKSRSREAK